MLQPLHGKKWSRSEKWLLGISLPAVLVVGWWSFHQSDQAVDISPFKMTLVRASFDKLAKPTIVPTASLHYARRRWPSKKMVPFRASIILSHDGPRPNWWGHENRSEIFLYFNPRNGMALDQAAGRFGTRFDSKSGYYVFRYECLMPEKQIATGISSCVVKGSIRFPLRYANMKDASAPTNLQQNLQFLIDVPQSS